jgi:hypothetical protein
MTIHNRHGPAVDSQLLIYRTMEATWLIGPCTFRETRRFALDAVAPMFFIEIQRVMSAGARNAVSWLEAAPSKTQLPDFLAWMLSGKIPTYVLCN